MLKIIDEWLKLIYPVSCLFCGKENSYPLCTNCFKRIDLIENLRCSQCGKPTLYETENCRECKNKKFIFRQARSIGLYRGVLKELIYKFKYHRHKELAIFFAELMAEIILREASFFNSDYLTFVPMNKSKKRKRGYNQAELMATELSKIVKIPSLDLLKQIRLTQDQSQLSPEQRRINVRGAFSLKDGVDLKKKKVILIDDVFTTGYTLNECSKMLRRAKAAEIRTFTIARASYLI